MIDIAKSIRINAPVSKVYEFWTQHENFVSLLNSVESIKPIDENRSHWVVRAPFGLREEFDSEIIERKENELIRWQARHTGVTGGVSSKGEIRFVPTDKGRATNVHVKFDYELSSAVADKVAQMIGKMGYPSRKFDRGLKEIKAGIEGPNAEV